MPPQEPATPHSAQITPGARERRRVLLAYFSRAGENYYYGGRTNLDVGNTEVLAGMIGNLIACNVHRIEAADPYPDGYARPAMASPLASIEEYDKSGTPGRLPRPGFAAPDSSRTVQARQGDARSQSRSTAHISRQDSSMPSRSPGKSSPPDGEVAT